jgi:hypothetical protein
MILPGTIRVAELKRQDLLAEVARDRRDAPDPHWRRPARSRRAVGAVLIRLGRRLQGGPGREAGPATAAGAGR